MHEYIHTDPLNPAQSKEESKVEINFWMKGHTFLHMLQQFDQQ